MRAIHKIIIHCTATREGDDISVDTIRRWHLARGWSDVGYHYVIDIKGNINAGRPIELMGAHCKGQNKYSIGVAYVGGVEADGKTPKGFLDKLCLTVTKGLGGAMLELSGAASQKTEDTAIEKHGCCDV